MIRKLLRIISTAVLLPSISCSVLILVKFYNIYIAAIENSYNLLFLNYVNDDISK